MPPQVLRDYQREGIAKIFAAWKQGARSVLCVSPTGSGKTSLFSWITSQIPVPVLINVHRRELATQACNRLREFGVDFGLIMSGEPVRSGARVQVASVQTLVRRKVPPAKLVINDEAHLSTAKTWNTILDEYPDARILGVTATPWRMSGKPLVGAYDAVVVVASPRELREQGHLCDYVGFSYRTPDLSDVKTKGDDYDAQQTAALMSGSVIVDSVVEEWLKHASDMSTVVFAVTVEHSQILTKRFRDAGVAAEHLDGSTPLRQREAILRRVANGETRVLCNVGVAIEGLDIPRLKCCVLARPTKSLARAIQMMGRVRRPWQGVTARIHDHAFVIRKHGLPDQDRDYTLTSKAEKPPSLTTCAECLALYSGPSCPSCSHVNAAEPTERVIQTVKDAEQYEFDSGSVVPEQPKPPVEVTWNTPGRQVEGRFRKSWVKEEPWGKRRCYLVTGAKRDYVLPGTAMLDTLMPRAKPGDLIRVTYIEERILSGGKTRKIFQLEIDDGKPDEPEPRRSLQEASGVP
jgi:DNA repair protein RadD